MTLEEFDARLEALQDGNRTEEMFRLCDAYPELLAQSILKYREAHPVSPEYSEAEPAFYRFKKILLEKEGIDFDQWQRAQSALQSYKKGNTPPDPAGPAGR